MATVWDQAGSGPLLLLLNCGSHSWNTNENMRLDQEVMAINTHPQHNNIFQEVASKKNSILTHSESTSPLLIHQDLHLWSGIELYLQDYFVRSSEVGSWWFFKFYLSSLVKVGWPIHCIFVWNNFHELKCSVEHEWTCFHKIQGTSTPLNNN